MSELHRHADDVIHRLKRRRKTHACYPCQKRKVRCDGRFRYVTADKQYVPWLIDPRGGHPCSVCKKRSHPEICFFDASNTSSQSSHVGGSSDRIQSPAAATGNGGHRSPSMPEDGDTNVPSTNGKTSRSLKATPPRTALGTFSGATYVQHALSPHTAPHLSDIRSGLGLENALTAADTHDIRQSGDDSRSLRLYDLCPTRSEVLRFFPLFRTHAAPFYPVISNVDDYEIQVHELLDQMERLRVKNQEVLHRSADDQRAAADLALLLSVLAVGAQFADVSSQTREALSQRLIDRCDACLRLARYTANPSTQTVQTLILMGLQAQNAGRSDEAWCLVGLNFRLAQSLGMEGLTAGYQHFLWTDHEHGFDYFSCMHEVCNLTRAFLHCERQERCDEQVMKDLITNLAHIKNGAVDRLRSIEHCTNIQQRLEFYALQMHTSFLTSEICRPFLLQPAVATETTEIKSLDLHQMGISCLQRTVEAYLSMANHSILPLRSWSLTHEAFTAVCVLILLDLRRTSKTVDVLLRDFQLFLERAITNEMQPETAANSMLGRGRKLFKLLEGSTNRFREDLVSVENRHQLSLGRGDAHPHIQPASETVDHPEALNEQSSEFEEFVDKFWNDGPFSEQDGTLLSLFGNDVLMPPDIQTNILDE